MCADKECPRRFDCHRYIGNWAIDYTIRQSMFTESPRDKDDNCEYFVERYWKGEKNGCDS